jgi:histidine decarboxylase
MSKKYLDPIAQQRLRDLLITTRSSYKHFLGFPASLDFNYRELAPIMQYMLNNIGDPLVETWHTLSSKSFEYDVLAFFAELFRAPKDAWWGYVANGSTECNLFALYVAREKLPDANVYYSQAAHYSVPKNIHLLRQRGVPVACQPNGEMDYTDLTRLLAEGNGQPAIVVASIGTTMTEAKDNVALIRESLRATGVMRSHIHADAALAGAYLPFIEPLHPFDFTDGADSINVSGHKFMGSPVPCGIILVHKEDKQRLNAAANYTGSIDATISGSRNGHAPLFLWYTLERWGKDGLKRRLHQSLEIAAYTHRRLLDIGWKTWRNPNTLTIMLATPPRELVIKWQLATQGEWSHVICMPGITKAKVDRFIADLATIS